MWKLIGLMKIFAPVLCVAVLYAIWKLVGVAIWVYWQIDLLLRLAHEG